VWKENNQQLPKKVIGVVKDYNQQSLRSEIGPIVFTLKKYTTAPWAGEFFIFKKDAKSVKTTLADVQSLWDTTYPQNPFDYFFMDEFFNAQYKNDEKFGKVFAVFSGLTIFIASLGLFGLTAYMTAMRTKEIGIRKVLGSSILELIWLLSGSYLVLVFVSFIIACPIAIAVMNTWLSQFAYRIPLDAWIFICAGLLCFLIALVTVGTKSWQSANLNPVRSLKYE
jgi:putative ABC transport system permease protein